MSAFEDSVTLTAPATWSSGGVPTFENPLTFSAASDFIPVSALSAMVADGFSFAVVADFILAKNIAGTESLTLSTLAGYVSEQGPLWLGVDAPAVTTWTKVDV